MAHKLLFIFILTSTILQGCSTNPVTGRKDFVLITESQEIAQGKSYHQQVLKQYRIYRDQELQNYVTRLGEEIAAKSHRSQLAFRFFVLDSPEVNAFAVPGGYIYITRGILAYMNSEAELAGVLGHEIGHVTARHSVRQQATSTFTNMLSEILLSGSGGSALAGNLINIAGSALTQGYGREHELEADRLGAEYLAKTGFDPHLMIDVVGILKNQEEFEKVRAKAENRKSRIYHGVFSSHPDNDKRLQEVVAAAKIFKNKQNRSIKEKEFLNRINGMTYGPSVREGVIRENTFYHPDLGFVISLPKDWRYSNQKSRLLAEHKSKEAFWQLTAKKLDKKISPTEIINTLSKNKAKNIKVINNGSIRGATAIMPAKTSWGTRNSRVTVHIFKNQAYIILAAAKTDAQFKQLDAEFLRAGKSFHTMSAAEKSQAKPQRIKIVSAKSTDTYKSLASTSVINKHALEKLRLLNDMFPTGQPANGQLIKIIH
ncbi:MAG: M48 family metalloprotease [Gammaproteobacteria bacterium]|nr:M48 family metalloprotease [Gammaproteobacteria bacterium]